MKSKILYFCLCALALLSSCSKSSGPFDVEVEYIPFQEEKGGLWGMIGTDGEVLFSEEFKEEPTVAINGRFMVKNSDGLLEYYTAEKKPRKIGGEYVEAALFHEEVAPAVRKDKAVELIDMDGNVVCTLAEAEGKRIMQVSNFSEGIAVIKTADGYGCINTSGEVVVKPVYASISQCSEGKMIALDAKYKDVEPAKRKVTVLDKKGNVKAEFGISNLMATGECFKEGLLPVTVEADGGKESGLVDENGEWVVKPSSKTREVSNVCGKHFVFYDGDRYGVKDIEGETVIRAKYRKLYFVSDKLLVFEDEKGEQGIVDTNGEKVTGETFDKVFGMFHDKYFVALTGRDNWEIMDLEGNSVSRKTDIYSIGLKLGMWTVDSHFFSYEALFGDAGISADAFGRFKLGMKAEEIAAASEEKPAAEIDPESYVGRHSVSYSTSVLGCSVTMGAVFISEMAYYDEYTDRRFSEEKPVVISAMFPESGRISGRQKETLDAANAYVKKFATFVKKDGDIALYQTKGGKYIMVTEKSGVTGIFMGDKTALGINDEVQKPAAGEAAEEDEAFQPDNHPANAGTGGGSLAALESTVSARKLTYNDISPLNKAQLRLLRNTIYARHGYIFKSDDLKNHFSKCSWYSPRHADVTGMLSGVEKYNVQFIKKYE